jgi:predicted ATPase
MRGGAVPPFADLLRRHRLAAGLTQEHLADLSRMSVSAIGTLERGTRGAPQRQTLELLASALQLAPDARAEFERVADRGRVRTRRIGQVGVAPNDAGLPAYLTSFVGREGELVEALALLREHRLVTITGAGGNGKTRLACAAAEVAGAGFERTHFLELARVTNPQYVAHQIAAALGISSQTKDAPRRIAERLSEMPTLLILDNCEHVVEAAAILASKLLRSCRDLRILATSRERLRISGEHILHLEPLQTDAALRLFIDRVREVDPQFGLKGSFESVARDVCRRLDGIPLAIELAAARLPSLGLLELQRRLNKQLALPGAHRDTPERHQTMQTTIAWSFELLDERERLLLPWLAIFVGGFTLSAAESVCVGEPLLADIGTVLARLVDKSIVQVSSGERFRYRLLEPVRLYGLDRLVAEGRYELAEQHHVNWILERSEAADRQYRLSGEHSILLELHPDFDNVRAALSRLIDRKDHAASALAARIAGGLRGLWVSGSHFAEAQQWSEQIETQLDIDRDPGAYALLLRLKVQTADDGVVRAVLQDAIQFFRRIDDRDGLVNAHLHLLFKLSLWDEVDAIPPVLKEAQALMTSESGLSTDLRARFYAACGHFEGLRGNFDRAHEEFEQAIQLISGHNSRWYSSILFKTAEVEALAGNYARAITILDVAVSDGNLEVERNRYSASYLRAICYFLSGDAERATRELTETMFFVLDRFDDSFGFFNEFVFIAGIFAAHHGLLEEAARLKGYAEANTPTLLIGAVAKRLLSALDDRLSARFGQTALEDLKRTGAGWSNAQALERALAALDVVG